MRVLVDTSVWSLAFRRRESQTCCQVEELKSLILDGRALMIGPIRQEILSGIRFAEQFERLESHLLGFPDEPLESSDFVDAARCCNKCLDSGVQTGFTDILICAVSIRLGVSIFTTDVDFSHIGKALPITLH